MAKYKIDTEVKIKVDSIGKTYPNEIFIIKSYIIERSLSFSNEPSQGAHVKDNITYTIESDRFRFEVGENELISIKELQEIRNKKINDILN